MAKKEKKQKKQKNEKVLEPQYYTSATNMPTYNYKVYYLKPGEKILYFLLAFLVGAAVGYLFYGGLARDEYGSPTTMTHILDVVISAGAGIAAGCAALPAVRKSKTEKQIRVLRNQFRDMLESLSVSLGAGKNVNDSFYSVNEDLKVQYDEDAYILKEMDVILSGLTNNVDLEDLLEDFGVRSGSPDIVSFANVFRICYRKGGNIKDVIRATHDILSDKMEITEDIETMVTSNKTEQKVMMVMPVVLIGMIKMMSPEFAANFRTPVGVIATTVGVILFVASYYIGKVVLNIKV